MRWEGIFPLLYFGAFFFFPISLLVGRFYIQNLGGTIERFGKLLFFNLFQAATSALIATTMGLLMSYVLARRKIPSIFKIAMGSVEKTSFVIPGISMAIGFYMMLGKKGFLNLLLSPLGVHLDVLYTFTAVILGHAFYNAAVTLYILGGAWENFDGRLVESAQMDGANDLQVFFKIELPLLLPALISSFLISFVYSFTSFAVVMTIGGPRYSTLEVEIYMYISGLQDFSAALSLTVLQMIVVAAAALTASFLIKTHLPYGSPRKTKASVLSYLMLIVPAFFVVTPIILSITSGFFYKGHPSLKPFNLLLNRGIYFIGEDLKGIALQTFGIASVAAVLSTTLGTITAFLSKNGKKIFYILPILPSSVSTVTLAFGYFLASKAMNINESVTIPILHSFLALPMVHLIMDSGWRKIPREVVEASMVDGASKKTRFFSIEFPLLLPHLFRSFFLAFAISMSDLSGVLILSEGKIVTFSRAVFRLLSSRHVMEAKALNTIFLATVLAFFLVSESLSERSQEIS